jgi:hypothetical protein
MNQDSKRLKEAYKTTKKPMGVFLIRNTANDKIFLASGQDLRGIINRHKFQLSVGSHQNRSLQHDWNELGSTRFEFEILDQMEPTGEASFDAAVELTFMEQMWLEKLKPFGDRGYNEKQLSRGERLNMIAANQRERF